MVLRSFSDELGGAAPAATYLREHASLWRRTTACAGPKLGRHHFYVLRTGCQWRALDQTELCAHSTGMRIGLITKLTSQNKMPRSSTAIKRMR